MPVNPDFIAGMADTEPHPCEIFDMGVDAVTRCDQRDRRRHFDGSCQGGSIRHAEQRRRLHGV